MSVIGLTIAALLAQATPAPTTVESAADRAAASAQKAAEAAQLAAEAAMRIADVIAPRPVVGAPTAVAAPKEEHWRGNVGLGLSYITGNSQTLTMTGNIAVDRKWDAWAMGVRLSGAYGLANPDTNAAGNSSATTARRAAGTVRGDRTFGESFAAIFVLAGSEFDHMKNIESRSIGEAGAGLTFFNKKEGDLEKLFLRLDLALRSGYETRIQYFPVLGRVENYGIVILAPRAAVAFRWAFSKDVRVSEDLEFIPFLLAPTSGRLLINNVTKLNARLTENLALTTALTLNFDSMPPEGAGGLTRKPTDVALTVGVEAAF